MKLRYPYLLPSEQPITSVAEYDAVRHEVDVLNDRVHRLLLAISHQRDSGKQPDPELLQELRAIEPKAQQSKYAFSRRLPCVLGSRCPYCNLPIWLRADVFSLADEFWYYEGGNGQDEALEESRCPHLFCVDGALNLNGYQPTEAHKPINMAASNDGIIMAAEVPFVKPRVLNLPTMVAVIHSFPVAERYTAYPIVYFAERQPDQMEFCIGWARTEYLDRHRPSGITMVGKCTDSQDYALTKWIRTGKLYWLNPQDEEGPLVREPVGAFPYTRVPGRQHPYLIKDGKVQDLPDPVASKPRTYMEDPWGPRIVRQ